MSTGSKEPENIVNDGVEQGSPAGGNPVPREEGQAAAHEGTGATGQQAAVGSGDANKAAGPAEEQDEQTGDDRGLTTDSSPD
ncbi:hypothetical protein QFZ79_001936 [Arthrobacter sp. V4I6]|uniref:hypothetical protein n=1 Tax=unclassified Arthrobacter TaxID=235627 RepID=UPI002787A3A1|nr:MULTISPECIES: hypothetical protein [unclassified Arthrobacter]MDQ0819645.1 hypothetical protein [Arthrobacter sp. V1I7]MDQ0853825.1 hypothetical protein [Arthrobacter sp. V4I6]